MIVSVWVRTTVRLFPLSTRDVLAHCATASTKSIHFRSCQHVFPRVDPSSRIALLGDYLSRRLVVRDWSVLSYRHIPTRCRRVLHSSPPRGLSPSLGRGLRYVSCHPLSLSPAIGRCTNLSTAIRQRLCDHAICTRRRHRLIAKMHISLWIIPSRRRIRLRKLQSS